MIKTISNEELKVELLPDIEDHSGIFKFSMLFNGYEYYGSLDGASEKARSKTRKNLTEVRNELFCSARASRHSDDERYLDVYQELLPILISKIENNKNT